MSKQLNIGDIIAKRHVRNCMDYWTQFAGTEKYLGCIALWLDMIYWSIHELFSESSSLKVFKNAKDFIYSKDFEGVCVSIKIDPERVREDIFQGKLKEVEITLERKRRKYDVERAARKSK